MNRSIRDVGGGAGCGQNGSGACCTPPATVSDAKNAKPNTSLGLLHLFGRLACRFSQYSLRLACSRRLRTAFAARAWRELEVGGASDASDAAGVRSLELMETEQERFVDALVAALAADRDRAAPGGSGSGDRALVRRSGPAVLHPHALGSEAKDAIDASDAWYPLEWSNVDRELDRADRVRAVDEVREAGEAISHEGDADRHYRWHAKGEFTKRAAISPQRPW